MAFSNNDQNNRGLLLKPKPGLATKSTLPRRDFAEVQKVIENHCKKPEFLKEAGDGIAPIKKKVGKFVTSASKAREHLLAKNSLTRSKAL